MTTPDTLELRRKAEAATPGPWKACGTIYEHMNCEVRGGEKGEGQGIAQVWDGPSAFKDGQWIAAANPAVILALLDRLDALEGREAWQPIETAPRDGDAILITRPTHFQDEEGWHVVRWNEIDGGWICHDGKFDTPLRGPDPTHWRPLPEAPTTLADEGRDAG